VVTLILATAPATLSVGCGSRVEERDAAVAVDDTSTTDLGPYAGDAWWLGWDAPVFETPPSIGMYPPNGAGPCDMTGCATPFSVCIPGAGWCCGGTTIGGPYPCSCGRDLGCLPPLVCCPVPTTEERRCKPMTECK